MKSRRIIMSIFWIVLGAVLIGCNLAGLLSEYWCGMGGGLLGAGIVQTIRNLRYLRDPAYREQVDTTNKDERNRYLARKAWSWAGYLYVMVAAAATVALQILGYRDLSTLAGISVCVILILYSFSYLFLQKKY